MPSAPVVIFTGQHEPMPTLSVVIPVYNEARTLPEVVRRVRQVPIDKELILVDAGRTYEEGKKVGWGDGVRG